MYPYIEPTPLEKTNSRLVKENRILAEMLEHQKEKLLAYCLIFFFIGVVAGLLIARFIYISLMV